MKLWIDAVTDPPDGYTWVRTVDLAKKFIQWFEILGEPCELIDIDHDAGDYAQYGGNYVKFLYWLEETNRNYPIRIHSVNSVCAENMRKVIQRNGWTEVR